MAEVAERALNVEFGRLAAARKIMGVQGSTGCLTQDRANAERWISRFGSPAAPANGSSAGAGGSSTILHPARESAAGRWVFYIHGGGMVYYSAAVFRSFLAELANVMHTPVEAFDYLKAPEHTVDQSVTLLTEHIAARCDALADRQLVLAGDSVGGLLALYVSLRALPETFSRIVLIYPVLDLHTERESYRAFGEGYFLDSDAMRLFKSILNPFFSERAFDPFTLSEKDLARLPACSVVTSGCDVLRDEGLAWVQHLAGRSIGVCHQHFPDLPHDFCLYVTKLPSARSAVAEIARVAFQVEEAQS
jgi:acetyl esterase